MIKMLKKQNDALHYWEVWYDEDEKTFTVHYGQVGERGEHFTEKKKRGNRRRNSYGKAGPAANRIRL